MRLRSRLPIFEQPHVEDLGLSPPTDGTPPVQIRLGSFYNPQSGNSLELGIRSSYHDLLGRPDGHLPNTQLETLSVRFRLQTVSICCINFIIVPPHLYATAVLPEFRCVFNHFSHFLL